MANVQWDWPKRKAAPAKRAGYGNNDIGIRTPTWALYDERRASTPYPLYRVDASTGVRHEIPLEPMRWLEYPQWMTDPDAARRRDEYMLTEALMQASWARVIEEQFSGFPAGFERDPEDGR